MSERALADRRRLREHAEAAERFRNCNQVLRILRDERTCVAVQTCDPALAVVAGQARVRRVLSARDAMAARAANGRGDELVAREAVAVSLDDGQRLVPEHEQRLALRRDPEQAFGDLAVRAAHAHLERADEHFALACLHGRNVFDVCCVRLTRLRDERQHLVPLPVMPPSFWVASTKPEAALARSKAGLPCCLAVSSATDSPMPAPITEAVTLSISRIPGPPAGPS